MKCPTLSDVVGGAKNVSAQDVKINLIAAIERQDGSHTVLMFPLCFLSFFFVLFFFVVVQKSDLSFLSLPYALQALVIPLLLLGNFENFRCYKHQLTDN